ncbi:30S ribosomal protein S1 [Pokkaliibacter plantistimulans]|uniref:30S ribosomal protein S1 n=2 Tax=Pseudomonadota TaxID=1224 RepID=A0ABX5LWC4_9GAMM|nr:MULTISPECIES: 30S ribosomal protein S1 [Pokkaliibacter]MDH2435080.1 30S ribosomal protein S1 [Pokkaliibacter sp. MBI-7]PPC77248.1 30S ribosomal protein S1 [Pokkaliibacter plantistimulans]PXF30464.1 30S ribosomal protein S1 [Pokkaliibacter plantistimulans]
MTESFAELFEASLKELEMQPGALVEGEIVAIDSDWVTVNAGLKSESVIPRSQFLNEKGELEVNVGDLIKVALEAVENGFGETRLSREKAKRAEAWNVLEKAFEGDSTVKGVISGKVKGGFTVNIMNIQGFLPGSLVDVRPVRDVDYLEGKELEFKLIKLDAKRNNIVVSRRAVLEAANSAQRDELLASLQEGQVVNGIVKNLTNYGAFIDLGGVDGLLHITDMAWKRISHPSEMLTPGDELTVKIIKFDRETGRLSLGLKQLSNDPWDDIEARYPSGAVVKAVVTNLTDYGCFAALEEGIEGLVHVSEMSWTNKNIHPSKVVQVGDDVEVMILDIDTARRRISLGLKQCQENPWVRFSSTYKAGDKVQGKIKTITDFGVFVGLEWDLDGLVHVSDLSWDADNEALLRQFKKGDEVEAVILAVDPEKERISLGIKQLESDPFSEFVTQNGKNSKVTGTVKEIVSDKEAVVELAEGIEGVLKSDTAGLNVGDSIEALIVNVDRKQRGISLSVKALEAAEERAALRDVRNQEVETSGPTTIGDLIKQQMANQG